MEQAQKEHTIETIKALLEKLREVNSGLTWELQCKYSNGEGQTLLEIRILRKENKQVKGHICFQEENHHVTNFRYNGISKTEQKPDNVVDLLLDIINVEGN